MHAERHIQPAVTEFTRYGADGARLTIERVGVNPTAFFVSGIHGDEHEVIEPLRRQLDRKVKEDPHHFASHVRALEAHPAALQDKVRAARGVDLNRQFVFKETPDHPQAKLLADTLLEHEGIHTVFSFHEDPLERRFYVYNLMTRSDDGSMDAAIESLSTNLLSRVTAMDIPLYNGIDDIDLGYWVDHGFCAVASDAIHDNSFEMWAVQNELHGHPSMQRAFLFEIPGMLPIAQKEELIRVILDEFIGPYMAHTQSGIRA